MSTILRGSMNDPKKKPFLMVGTVCSTFVPINAGTHGRSITDPMGRVEHASVQLGNALVSRLLVGHLARRFLNCRC